MSMTCNGSPSGGWSTGSLQLRRNSCCRISGGGSSSGWQAFSQNCSFSQAQKLLLQGATFWTGTTIAQPVNHTDMHLHTDDNSYH